MDAVLLSWQAWIVATSCQLCVLVAAVAGLELLLGRRAWPEVRAGLWTLVMLKLVLPPSLQAPWSLVRIGPGQHVAAAVPWSWPGLGPGPEPGPGTVAAGLFLVWVGGAVAFLAVALARQQRLARGLGAGARQAPPELKALAAALAARLSAARPPEILVAAGAPHALVLGFLRPRVFLAPDLARRIGSAELEHVLLHELAHCVRKDPLRALACLVLHAAFWFHPLVWWAAARLHTLRELCTDQVAVEALGGDPRPYRETLLRRAESLLFAAPAGVHAFGHPRSMLMQRLLLLSGRSRPGRIPRALTACGTTLLLAIACVPQGALPAPPRAEGLPSLADLPGCLQRRFLVLAALAQQEALALPPAQYADRTTDRPVK